MLDVETRKERPPFVRFEKVAVEDAAASRSAGRYIARDVDFALVTPPYSKDVFKQEVKDYLESMKRERDAGRFPPEWLTHIERAYAEWQRGNEIPLNGTPIKGWGLISPAQQENLIRLNILTVEDLAAMNEEKHAEGNAAMASANHSHFARPSPSTTSGTPRTRRRSRSAASAATSPPTPAACAA